MADNPQSLYISIQYPSVIGQLTEDKLDTLLSSIQKNQALYQYECALTTLTTTAGESIPINTPFIYSKKAPSYITTKSDQLIPLILVTLTFGVAVSSAEAGIITNTIDDLIQQQLVPKESKVTVKILVTSLSNGLTQRQFYLSAKSGPFLPPPYYKVVQEKGFPRMLSVVILLAILCLGVLLINFALHFHFQ